MLLSVAERLRERVPELWFLLTGPSRGYVRAGLDRLGIPYRHALLDDVDAVAQAYEAIDVCVVTSRDEGGPRAVLEAMATGVPFVTTRVGQAADLVAHGVNGWLVDVEDVDGARRLDRARRRCRRAEELDACGDAGRSTAEANSYPSLRPRWRALLDGFVALARGSTVTRGSEPRARRAVLARGIALGEAARQPGRAKPGIRVFYGHDRVPARRRARRGRHGEDAEARRALSEPSDRLLDAVPRHDLAAARPRSAAPASRAGGGAPVVVNQDGVAYPGWAGTRVEELNRPLREALLAADHILYQSEFCGSRRSSTSASPTRRRRSSTTRSTSRTSRRRPRRLQAGRCFFSEETRPRSTGSSSRSARSRR